MREHGNSLADIIQQNRSFIKNEKLDETKIQFYDGKLLVSPEDAKNAMLKFLLSEIGPFIEAGFKEERERFDSLIANEHKKLTLFINKKIDKVSEDIVRELKHDNISDDIIERIISKLKTVSNEC